MLNINLRGKTAVITGSTMGIGLAIAKTLAQAGAAVVVNGRQRSDVEQAVAAVQAHAPGATVQGAAADLATAEGCQTLVAQVPHCDILVNNLGIYRTVPFFDIDDAEWQRYWDVNIMSGVRLSRAYMPQMLERNWGRVVFIASESALNIPADMVHYGMSKTAMLGLARGLAKMAAGTGVTVNSVLPGPTLSKGAAKMLMATAPAGQTLEQAGVAFVKQHRPSSIIGRAAQLEVRHAEIAAGLPDPSSIIGRAAQLEEVANMVAYVASPLSSATTGAALRVEGGIVDSL